MNSVTFSNNEHNKNKLKTKQTPERYYSIFDAFLMEIYSKKMSHLSLDRFVIKILFLLSVDKKYLRKISKSI